MLGYGAMELRGAPRGRDVTESRPRRILNAVLDAGINYIDTSIDYGVSEERIGRYIARSALRILSREQVRLPGGCPAGPARPEQPARLHPRQHPGGRGAEPRPHADRPSRCGAVPHLAVAGRPWRSTAPLETVLELKRAGKVRFIGMSGTLPNLADHIAMGVFDVFQIPYSAVEREHEALIAAAAEAGAGIVIRGGAAKGAPTEGKQDGVQWERWQQVRPR